MTVAEARAILDRHDWTQAAIASAMGVHLRTAQRWFTETERDVPGPVAALLRLYDAHPAVRPAVLGGKP
jgi:transcriptional regulator with XRE-family HTH domain